MLSVIVPAGVTVQHPCGTVYNSDRPNLDRQNHDCQTPNVQKLYYIARIMTVRVLIGHQKTPISLDQSDIKVILNIFSHIFSFLE